MNDEIKLTPCQKHDEELIKQQEARLIKIKDDISISNKIIEVNKSLVDLLLYKNNKYGDSALKPINIFSKSNSSNGLLLRIDDKISRIHNSKELRKNDIVDLIGYLTLLCIDKEWTNFDEFKD